MPLTFNERIKLILGGDFNLVVLGVKFDYNLTFNSHISDLCKSTSQKSCISKICTIHEHFERLYFNECLFLNHSLTTVLWYGCVTVEKIIGK